MTDEPARDMLSSDVWWGSRIARELRTDAEKPHGTNASFIKINGGYCGGDALCPPMIYRLVKGEKGEEKESRRSSTRIIRNCKRITGNPILIMILFHLIGR